MVDIGAQINTAVVRLQRRGDFAEPVAVVGVCDFGAPIKADVIGKMHGLSNLGVDIAS